EIIVVEHRVVNAGDDAVGGGVGCELRIEARLGDGECDAQRLAGVGAIAARRRARERQEAQRCRREPPIPPPPDSPRRMHVYAGAAHAPFDATLGAKLIIQVSILAGIRHAASGWALAMS